MEEGNQISLDGTLPPIILDYGDTHAGVDTGMHLLLKQTHRSALTGFFGVKRAEPLCCPQHLRRSQHLHGSLREHRANARPQQRSKRLATGHYEFDNLFPGTYSVVVSSSVDGNNNYVFGSVVEEGNQISLDGTLPPIILDYGAAHARVDAGMHLLLSTVGSNAIFNNADGDGVQDKGKEPVAKLLVTLICNKNALAQTASNAKGQCGFTDVDPGECVIHVPASPHFTFSPVVEDGKQVAPDGTLSTVTVGYNNTVSTGNAKIFLPPPTVGHSAMFNDKDGDSRCNPQFEPPLLNVTINFCCYQDGEAVLPGTTATHVDSKYVFDDVLPGQCYAEVTPPDACKFLPIESGSNQINSSTGTSPVVDIDWNNIIDDWEEGVCLPVLLGNKVWDDFNGNGVQDEGKPGMPGVIVTLSDKNGNLMMELATSAEAITITAADGSYWFTGLVPGEYGHPQSTQALGSTSAIIALTAAPLAPVVHGTHLPMALYHTPANVCAPRSVGLLPQATNTLTATLLAPPIMSIPFQCLAQTQQRGA